MTSPLTFAFNDIAREEGWLLIDYDHSGLFQIQRFDAASTFTTDDEALTHVALHSRMGSRFHAQALEAHRRDAKAIHDMKRGLRHMTDDSGNHICTSRVASAGALRTVLAGDHSPAHWFRLANGDLIIGVYPQAGTYEQFEKEYP